jgi:ABC-type thiamin/hydroxymethylpyrimidine transport system permease subunit
MRAQPITTSFDGYTETTSSFTFLGLDTFFAYGYNELLFSGWELFLLCVGLWSGILLCARLFDVVSQTHGNNGVD